MLPRSVIMVAFPVGGNGLMRQAEASAREPPANRPPDLGAFIYELARGQDASPYTQLGAVAGVSYLVALVVLQRRS